MGFRNLQEKLEKIFYLKQLPSITRYIPLWVTGQWISQFFPINPTSQINCPSWQGLSRQSSWASIHDLIESNVELIKSNLELIKSNLELINSVISERLSHSVIEKKSVKALSFYSKKSH